MQRSTVPSLVSHLVAALVLGAVALGCGQSGGAAGSSASAQPSSASGPASGASAQAKTASSGAASSDGAKPTPLAVGDTAPDVTLQAADGKPVKLGSLAGKLVLVYFYPKDDTPGCTIEAKGIRDGWTKFQEAGIEVYGISGQGADSHKAFADKYSLPFPLVPDEGGKIADAFHVPHKGEFASRQSFLIGKDGKILKVWLEVDPSAHADAVLAAAH